MVLSIYHYLFCWMELPWLTNNRRSFVKRMCPAMDLLLGHSGQPSSQNFQNATKTSSIAWFYENDAALVLRSSLLAWIAAVMCTQDALVGDHRNCKKFWQCHNGGGNTHASKRLQQHPLEQANHCSDCKLEFQWKQEVRGGQQVFDDHKFVQAMMSTAFEIV